MKPVLIINIFQGQGRFRAIAAGNDFIAMQADGDTLVKAVENVMTEMKMANPTIGRKLRRACK